MVLVICIAEYSLNRLCVRDTSPAPLGGWRTRASFLSVKYLFLDI